ncbi:MAG TPA: stage II sporulation protein M [Bacillota bacterium]|nr:stage II sporulation protein M [Bacillota bacterium]
MFTLFKPAGQVIRQNRSWLYMAIIIFLLSGIFFYAVTGTPIEPLDQLTSTQMEQLQELFSTILEQSPATGIMLLFMNNFLAVAQMLLLGAVAGIMPMLTLIFNGAMLGTAASQAADAGLPLLPLLLLGIAPHGIFELFAFFLCGALGLKFGYHCVASPLPGKTRLESFIYIWKETLTVLPLVTILLMIAALVEILVTPRLVGLLWDLPL